MADRVTGTLLFDGACSFCTTSARIAARIAPGATVLPWQRADLAVLGVPAEAAAESVQWVSSDGQVVAGAAAMARLLVDAGRGWAVLGRLMLVPGVRQVAAAVYRLVAANRHRLPGGTPACRAD